MRFGLHDSTLAQIQTVLARHPQVQRAILYGSRAMGNFKNGSDIDLTLVGGDDLNPQILRRIMNEIDDLLLPYSFDLSIFHLLDDPDVVDHIRRVGQVFYEKDADSQKRMPPQAEAKTKAKE